MLASPRARVFVPLVACLLTLPSLVNGFAFDDQLIRLKARGVVAHGLWQRLDLFAFVPADPAARQALREQGFVPWFAAPDLKLAFFRPVSSLLSFLDYNLLDRWALPMHAESIAIYAVAVALGAALYRRFLPYPVAMLAALLYAVQCTLAMSSNSRASTPRSPP
jgi:hypothetical protein